jgi:uncharacterized membrane protein YedE/YeeE
MSLQILLIGFLFGIGFGYCVQRAGLCFAHGLGEIYMGRGKRILRLFCVIFSITAIGFLLSAKVNPELGLKTIGQIRGYGFWNIISGIIFGAGILLNGGCILGTLRQIGEGNMLFLVVLISTIPGMALIVKIIDPFLTNSYATSNKLLSDLIPIPVEYIIYALVTLALMLFLNLLRNKQ